MPAPLHWRRGELFTFQSRTKVIFGERAVERLGAEVRALGAGKVLVVTDRGILRAGLLARVERPLREAKIGVAVFDQVVPNPTATTVFGAAQAVRDEAADLIIGFGGGSPIDTAKAAAVMSVNEGTVEQYCAEDALWSVPPIPIVAVPTTAGTGSEVSATAMISNTRQGTKMAMFGHSLLPAVAIVDPGLTLSLPPALTALTGVDALSHAVEAYTSNRANPIADALAFRAVELIVGGIRKAYADGHDMPARSDVMLGSTVAVLAAANAGLGIIHSLAHALGGQYGMPHGQVVAIGFPHAVEYNAAAVPEKYARLARVLGRSAADLSTEGVSRAAAGAVIELLDDLDIDRGLRAWGVEREALPRLAQMAARDGCTRFNPRPIGVEGFVRLLESACPG